MKKVIIILTALTMLAIFVGVYINSRIVGTQYAVKYAQVFGSYDIKMVDQYLNEETRITYRGKTDNYSNLRNNVIAAFEEQEYEMPDGSSYGHGNDIYLNGTQNIGIQAYVSSDTYSSDFVSMDIKCKWLVFYDIISLSSDDDFFGYLFFGIKKE